MTNDGNGAHDEAVGADLMIDIRHLSTDQLQQLGVSQLAYVRPVIVNGTPCVTPACCSACRE